LLPQSNTYAKKAMNILPNYIDCEDITPWTNLSKRSFKDFKKGVNRGYYFENLGGRGAKSGYIIFSLVRSA
jgi:hypothetical protein